MVHCRIFLFAVFAVYAAAAAPAAAGFIPRADAMLLAAGTRDLGLKHIKLQDLNFAAAEKAAAAAQAGKAAAPARAGAAGPRAQPPDKAISLPVVPEQEEKTSLDISFGDDDDDGSRPDGGINKLSSPASVGLEHKLSENWRLGGAALFAGRGRGAAARLGFSW